MYTHFCPDLPSVGRRCVVFVPLLFSVTIYARTASPTTTAQPPFPADSSTRLTHRERTDVATVTVMMQLSPAGLFTRHRLHLRVAPPTPTPPHPTTTTTTTFIRGHNHCPPPPRTDEPLRRDAYATAAPRDTIRRDRSPVQSRRERSPPARVAHRARPLSPPAAGARRNRTPPPPSVAALRARHMQAKAPNAGAPVAHRVEIVRIDTDEQLLASAASAGGARGASHASDTPSSLHDDRRGTTHARVAAPHVKSVAVRPTVKSRLTPSSRGETSAEGVSTHLNDDSTASSETVGDLRAHLKRRRALSAADGS